MGLELRGHPLVFLFKSAKSLTFKVHSMALKHCICFKYSDKFLAIYALLHALKAKF